MELTVQMSEQFLRLLNSIDNASNVISHFYNGFTEQKLKLCEEHIEQVARIKKLEQRKQMRNSEEHKELSINPNKKNLKKLKKSNGKKIKVNPEIILKSTTLEIDLKLEEASQTTIQFKNDLLQSLDQDILQLDLYGINNDLVQTIPFQSTEHINTNKTPIASQKKQMIKREKLKEENQKTPSEKSRVSLIEMFSEMKISNKSEKLKEKAQSIEYADSLDFDQIEKPQDQNYDKIFSDLESTPSESLNDHSLGDYDMTDYSSNESSNAGSPIFEWVNEQEYEKCPQFVLPNFLKEPTSSSQNIPQMQIQGSLNPLFSQQQHSSTSQNIFEQFSNSGNNSSQNSQGTQKSKPKESKGDVLNYLSMFSQNSGSLSQPSSYQGLFQKKGIMGSPQKIKEEKQRKILYCNHKQVPNWAQDLQLVKAKLREQNEKNSDFSEEVFGLFTVENLSLNEVFRLSARQYDQGRGSSANWRQELTPDQIQGLIEATSHTPSKKKNYSKFTNFLSNSFNSIKKKLL